MFQLRNVVHFASIFGRQIVRLLKLYKWQKIVVSIVIQNRQNSKFGVTNLN